ncbi:hypothetical protein WEI85_07170 [Actinomycetes bacterium KLBMP 9797]
MTSTLEKLRPATTVDNLWPAPARDAALERLLATAASPQQLAPRPRRGRRVLATAALTLGLVASGVGVAGAAGVLPESFTRELSFWASETKGGVDVGNARRVAQTPGPDGTVLSLWAASGTDGTTCVSALFEPPGPLDRPAPSDFRGTGGHCTRPQDRQRGLRFGSGGGSSTPSGVHTWIVAAGDAVRAELRLATGSTRPVPSAEGVFFFWYLADEHTDPPVLAGYDAAGRAVQGPPLPR